jgi:putative MATE family efflux protein
MFGWGTGRAMGIAGAGLASLIAITIGVVWLAVYVVKHEAYLQFAARDWKPQLPLWWRMLRIGLPTGVEFALMAVYLFIIYGVARPFGAAAQAGFGIGLRVVQASFLPVVALGFAVAPVGAQNFGARFADRVRETFRSGVKMAAALMLVLTALCVAFPEPLIRVFSRDAQVIAVGADYLRIVALNFVASGVIFVSSSMFQAIGNTVPPMISSFLRIFIIAIPVVLLSKLPAFELRWVWYLSVASVWLQMGFNLLLLHREFRKRLNFATPDVTAAQPVAAN